MIWEFTRSEKAKLDRCMVDEMYTSASKTSEYTIHHIKLCSVVTQNAKDEFW